MPDELSLQSPAICQTCRICLCVCHPSATCTICLVTLCHLRRCQKCEPQFCLCCRQFSSLLLWLNIRSVVCDCPFMIKPARYQVVVMCMCIGLCRQHGPLCHYLPYEVCIVSGGSRVQGWLGTSIHRSLHQCHPSSP
jgi:hypothetical protein